jgi:hypothetical protein
MAIDKTKPHHCENIDVFSNAYRALGAMFFAETNLYSKILPVITYVRTFIDQNVKALNLHTDRKIRTK